MRFIIGIGLIITGIIALVFAIVKDSSGSINLFIMLSFLVGSSFLRYGFVSFLKRINNRDRDKALRNLELFKTKCFQIQLDFEKCQFKGNDFYNEVENPLKNNMIGSQYSFLIEDTITVQELHSCIVYEFSSENSKHRYISQPFSMNVETLKMYVLQHRVILYVNRENNNEYYFEVNRF
jgi:hypothetical protein